MALSCFSAQMGIRMLSSNLRGQCRLLFIWLMSGITLSIFQPFRVFGFVIVDGSGCLFGTLTGREKKVVDQFSVNLPKKHSKGGQSALRFARLRLEKRYNYMKKVAEHAKRSFISGDTQNITGLIVAGAAEFKSDLTSRCLLDTRLQDILIDTLDIAHGGESGFDQAISLSGEMLKGLDFLMERQVISNFLGEVARGRGMYCIGVRDTMAALEMGAVETLVVWEELPVQRLVVRNTTQDADAIDAMNDTTGADVVFVDPSMAERDTHLHVVESARLSDWIVVKNNTCGAIVEFVTDQSPEGMQFCKGFGGIGGILRYSLEFDGIEETENEDSDSDSDFA
eukprot:TRINITY_DN17354_c0_g1_i1.p1 TRINITY_DN17354_c0_g1~~TRINITY_DN17354_c0_g1_i1.p1  ORF type:complete len:339 (+),score=64.45 TRINITY_DN17354_c0_g1_i1:419-1435(+)